MQLQLLPLRGGLLLSVDVLLGNFAQQLFDPLERHAGDGELRHEVQDDGDRPGDVQQRHDDADQLLVAHHVVVHEHEHDGTDHKEADQVAVAVGGADHGVAGLLRSTDLFFMGQQHAIEVGGALLVAELELRKQRGEDKGGDHQRHHHGLRPVHTVHDRHG